MDLIKKKTIKKPIPVKSNSNIFTDQDLDLLVNGSIEEKRKVVGIMVDVLLRRNELKFEREALDKQSRHGREFFIDYLYKNEAIFEQDGYEISVGEYKKTKFLKIKKIGEEDEN